MVRTFGIVHLAGTPFSLASAPFLMDQAPLLRGVPAKFHKMELPPNLTVQKIPYIPYRIYQPASAGNLPIPAKLPVNRWDTTLVFMDLKALLCSGDDESPQHRSVLGTINNLNSPKSYIRLLGGLSPIHLTCRHGVKGLMWGARGPFPPAAAMVGYGCDG